MRLTQDDGENILLQSVKIRVSVDVHVLPREVLRGSQRVAQLLHPRARVAPARVELRIIRAKEERYGLQLIAHCPADLLRLFVQLLRADLIGIELLRQLHQLLQKCRALGRVVEHLELPAQFLQRKAHRQEFSAAVERHVRQTARAAQNARGEVLEAQHLGIAAGRLAAGAAQIHLRAVRRVLRYDEHLRALRPLRRDGAQHLFRLAGPRPADPDGEHGSSPFLSCVIAPIIPYPRAKHNRQAVLKTGHTCTAFMEQRPITKKRERSSLLFL